MTTTAKYKNQLILKTPNGYFVGKRAFKSLAAATEYIDEL